MKILILTVIVLVIPLFFILIFVLGTYNRLATLRRRCEVLLREAGNAIDPAAGREEFHRAIDDYNTARSAFPASVIAGLFGLAPLDASGDGPVQSAEALRGIRLVASVYPTVLFFVCTALLVAYGINKHMTLAIAAELEERRRSATPAST